MSDANMQDNNYTSKSSYSDILDSAKTQNGACINIAHTHMYSNPVVLDRDSSDWLLWLRVQAEEIKMAGLLF